MNWKHVFYGFVALFSAAAIAETSPEVREAIPSVENTFLISHDANRRWGLGDYVCVSRNRDEIGCGVVVEVLESQARVKLTTKMKGLVPAPPGQSRKNKKPASEAKPVAEPEKTVPVPPAATESPEPARTLRRFSISGGFRAVRYREKGQADYSGTTALVGGAVRWTPSPPWALVADIFADLLPVSKNRVEAARFLGLGARAEYRLAGEEGRTSFLPALGLRYRTMLVDSSAFGMKHLFALELGARLEIPLSARDNVSMGLLVSPIGDGLKWQLSDRTLGGAVEWKRSYLGTKALLIRLEAEHTDFSDEKTDGDWLYGALGVGWSW